MSPKINYTEEELVAALLDKDSTAFSYLYDNYSKALMGFILRVIPDEEMARDCLQDAFVKIWRNFENYDPSKGRLFTWMINIARNQSIDEVRSKAYRNTSKNQSLDNSVYEVVPDLKETTSSDHIGLKEVVSSLEDNYKVVIDLAYYKGYTQEEISTQMGIPLGTVKTRIRSAMQQLRKALIDKN